MKNKEKYNIRYMTFNVSQNQNGTIKSIDIYYNLKRIEKIKFLNETSATQAMNAVGNWLEEEYVPDILTEKEKAYLSVVIRPFIEKVEYVYKICSEIEKREYLEISLENGVISFPYFEKGTMYKGMEAKKTYTLEELGL